MGIARLEGETVRLIASARDPKLAELHEYAFPRSEFSPRMWPASDEFVVLVGDAPRELDARFAADRFAIEGGYRSLLRLPLGRGAQRYGSLLLSAFTPGRFTREHAQRLELVAELLSLSVAHQRLAEEAGRAAAAQERASRLEERVEALSHELEASRPHRALGRSPLWKEVLRLATKVAPTETTVLLTGESGTGKEVVARFLHRSSPRSGGPFVALNCAAIPEQLLESELFGHERGAFTGAHSTRPGKLEQASGGVLFLDEVGEMSPAVQAKFLRVLQEREFQRLGGTRTLPANARVLAATNRDLKLALAQGRFREDLYYRLAVFELALPPLRERRDDILLLVSAFLDELGRSMGRSAAGVSDDARTTLLEYAWPGNVRELENAIERAIILCDGGLITSEHLPFTLRAHKPASAASPAFAPGPSHASAAPLSLDAAEREMIVQALARTGNNKSKAARLLGLTRAQLRSRIDKHGLSTAD
jgi:transcriptional regulator with GAF, ATPase, and Fis domain